MPESEENMHVFLLQVKWMDGHWHLHRDDKSIWRMGEQTLGFIREEGHKASSTKLRNVKWHPIVFMPDQGPRLFL
jgi:hypothetical protein